MNDDILTLYYYDDGLSLAERRTVADALKRDSRLHAHYEALVAELESIADTDGPAAPAHFVAQLHDSLDRAATRERQREKNPQEFSRFPAFGWSALVAAALALGIGIGVYLGDGQGPAAVVPAGIVHTTPGAGESSYAFERGLKVHLRNTRQDLAGTPDVAQRTELAGQIIRQNRLFERAAEQHNAQDLARVLRAFEPILLRLAADDIAPAEAEALQMQLAFELNVMLTKLGRKDSEEAGPI